MKPIDEYQHTPSVRDINIYDSLDEQVAARNFAGKNLAQAEELFQENFLYYQECLMWMGPRAFCYYVRSAISYLLSPASDGASDAVSCFCSVIEFRLEHDRDEIQPAIPLLCEAVQCISTEFSRYDCDPEIYGDLLAKYRILHRQLC